MKGYTLITGGAGFIGTNLADALLGDGERVVIADNLSRTGVHRNAHWLMERHPGRVRVEKVDVTDEARITPLVQGAGTVFHLAAQVAVTTSVADPRHDFDVNLRGTFNVLEAARTAETPPAVVFTSTNKVYGGLDHLPVVRGDAGYAFADTAAGVSESEPLDFHSPYGCSKGAADQYVRDYARIFGVPTVVFRMSCIYGEHQHGTEDQGWVAHFARSILAGRPLTVYGDGEQVRDILWAGDLVRALRAAAAGAERLAGSVFNVGGGARNAVSVRQVIERLMQVTGRHIPVRVGAWRPGDQRCYVTDTARAEAALDWRPAVAAPDGLDRMVRWLRAEAHPPRVRPPRRAAARVVGGTP